jgi:5-methylcytosine-specific restriction enzyme subunit McrC
MRPFHEGNSSSQRRSSVAFTQHGQVACAPDELSHDVLHNRLLRTTLRRLSEANIDSDLSRHLGSLVSRFTDVSEVEPSASLFRRLQFRRNNSHYAFLLHVCEIVHRCLLVDPATGRYRFHDFRGDEQEMGRLFQAFIRNFLHREQETFVVSAERLRWDALSTTEADARWLPVMQTDISLASARHRVIIETKYYREPFQLGWSDRPTLRSDHLYQLFAYLKNAGMLDGAAPSPAGVLLYAAPGQHLNLRYRLAGHDVFVRTLDLDQPGRASGPIYSPSLTTSPDLRGGRRLDRVSVGTEEPT